MERGVFKFIFYYFELLGLFWFVLKFLVAQISLQFKI